MARVTRRRFLAVCFSRPEGRERERERKNEGGREPRGERSGLIGPADLREGKEREGRFPRWRRIDVSLTLTSARRARVSVNKLHLCETTAVDT